MSADLVMINGNIITVDRNFSIARAVAVKDEKIMAVGTNDEIKTYVGRRTKTLDLKGGTVLPGINDAHIHAALYWGSRPPVALDVSYPAIKTIRDILNIVGKKVQTVKSDEWIWGTGLNLSTLKECKKVPTRYPTRRDLDIVAPDNPVYLGAIPFTLGENVTWLNTKALELVGITKDTEPPPGCDIVRDPTTGEPTGLLKGTLLAEMAMSAMPRVTREQKKLAILTAMKELNSLGIASITEGALGPGGVGYQGGLWDSECIDVYKELANYGKLSLRVSIMILLTPYGAYSPEVLYKRLPVLGIDSGFDNNWLRISGLKLFADGIPLSKNAWMYEEYEGGGNGHMVFTGKTDEERRDELMNIVAHCHKLGFRVGIHVTGDRAIDACIDSFVEAEREEPKGLRHYLIHADFVSPNSAKRMAANSIGVSVQPALSDVVKKFLPYVVGKERAARYGCLRTMLDAGVHIAGGSDAPVTYPNWKQAIQSIVSRDYTPATGSKRHVTAEEAIRMYTIEGAWQDHMEGIKGSIEVGKMADFCILDENILTIEPHRIKDIQTVMTIVGGKIVYDAGSYN